MDYTMLMNARMGYLNEIDVDPNCFHLCPHFAICAKDAKGVF